MKYFFATLALLAASCASFATPVDLGDAGNFSLLGTDGTLILGASAHVAGDIGASNHVVIGSGATVDGDAYSTNLPIIGAGASITGRQNIGGSGIDWPNLSAGLSHASATASAKTADQTLGTIATSTTLNSQNGSVFEIAGLRLGSNQRLTLKGGPGDQFIINVDNGGFFSLGSGASIVLDGGISPDDVLFNLTGSSLSAGSNSIMMGTYLAPANQFMLGSSLNAEYGHFLAKGISVGSCADIGTHTACSPDYDYDYPSPTPSVPEPPVWALMLLGLALTGLGSLSRYRQQRYF
jgi:choice-of-anchor A domain-containing protein